MYTSYISCAELAQHLENPDWIIVDCRFSLEQPDLGRIDYLRSHLPRAIYLHLNDDLSCPPSDTQGRHPLPSTEEICALFGRIGVTPTSQVIVYDNMSGAFGARLWWMLRYMGHSSVALLDGGWSEWVNGGYPISSEIVERQPVEFSAEPNRAMLVRLEEVSQQPLLVDSRDPKRYRGEVETIDPRAGHIPGAVNYFFGNNWDTERHILPSDQLREKFDLLFNETPAEEVTFYCGSGVTACFNLAAVHRAGLPLPKLYLGSWSEWCRDENRPIELG